MWLPPSLLVLAASSVFARWNDPDAFPDGRDLEHFVSRPDLAAPRYVVTKYHPEAIADGYWFVAPYSSLFSRGSPGFRQEHIPCQTGAHIYDNDGVLVWSGACKYTNRNVYAFRPVTINGTQFLSFHQAGEDVGDGVPEQEANVLLNEHYEEVRRIANIPTGGLDMHEFNILPDGKSAIMSFQKLHGVEVQEPEARVRSVINPGFVELDLATEKPLFTWNGLDNGLSVDETLDYKGRAADPDLMWDAFHINSIDKDSSGDYYVSLRHACTIYKISKIDGSIIWRLGGLKNQFTIAGDATFKWQHHIRVRFHNETHTVVSLFDNASEDEDRSFKTLPQETSVGKILILDNTARTATLLRSFERPDRGQSLKLGSLQLIGEEGQLSDPSEIEQARVFMDWARQGYISEYDGRNRLLMEAHFESDRMKSYRAYKYKFVGRPRDRPAVRLIPMASAQDGHDTASAYYVSWNGATEVVSWTFYGSAHEKGPFEKLAVVRKIGFETSWVVPGQVPWGFAEALDRNGAVLGKSYLVALEPISNRNYDIPPSHLPAAMASNTKPPPHTPPREKKPKPTFLVGRPKQPYKPGYLKQLPEAQSPEAQSPEVKTPAAQTPEEQTPEAQTPMPFHRDEWAIKSLVALIFHLATYAFATFGVFCAAKGTILLCISRSCCCRWRVRRSWHHGTDSEDTDTEASLKRALLADSPEALRER